MTERKIRTEIVKMLKPIGAFAVENPACPGTPDIATTLGWIELKIGKVPVDPNKAPKVDLRSTQRVWLRKWHAVGGVAWTLTKFDHGSGDPSWLLHRGSWAHSMLGRASYAEHVNHAHGVLWGRLPYGLLCALTPAGDGYERG